MCFCFDQSDPNLFEQIPVTFDQITLSGRHRVEVDLDKVLYGLALVHQPPVERVEAGAQVDHLHLGVARLQKLVDEVAEPLDPGVVAQVDFGRPPLALPHHEGEVGVRPVAQRHGGQLAGGGIVVGALHSLITVHLNILSAGR